MSYWPEPPEMMAGNEPGDEPGHGRLVAFLGMDHLARAVAAESKLTLIRAYCVAALTPSCVGEPSVGRDAFAAVVLAMVDGEAKP